MSPRDREYERAWVHKTAQSISQLLASGDTHPQMREIQIAAFLNVGYEPEMVSEAFGLSVGEQRIRGAVAARET